MMDLSLWSENSAKLTLLCEQHGQNRAGCRDASMMGLSLWSENSAKLTLFCEQHGQHRAGCGDASMVVLPLWSENLASTALFCEQHGHELHCGSAFGSYLNQAHRLSSERPELRSILGDFLLGFPLSSRCKLVCNKLIFEFRHILHSQMLLQ